MSGGVMITATGSNHGKTIITFGLIAAMKRKGFKIRSFKTGPDYIDPLYHEKISKVECINLDPFFVGEYIDENSCTIKEIFKRYTQNFDCAVTEGAMGYFSGIYLQEPRASAYSVACIIKPYVIIVIDKNELYEKGAGIINEYIEKYIKRGESSYIKGFILNKIQHDEYNKFKYKIKKASGLKPLGYIPYISDFEIPSRHLGLCMPDDTEVSESIYKIVCRLADIMEKSINLEYIIKVAILNKSLNNVNLNNIESLNNVALDNIKPLSTAVLNHIKEPETAESSKNINLLKREDLKVRLAFAYDKAFLFIYKENIRILEENGFDIVYFSPLSDDGLPENIDCIWIPGGYPERYAKELSENKKMINSIKKAYADGINIVAECGGFMYLHEKLEDENGSFYPCIGIIKGNAVNKRKLVRFGYIEVCADKDTLLLKKTEKCRSHEFHYWESDNTEYSCSAVKANGSKSWRCIYSSKNIFAGFPHIYLGSNVNMAKNLYNTVNFK